MKYPSTRLVFDRKKQATKQKAALVQVEILFGKKKKYVTTGVKLCSDQWDDKVIVKNSTEMLTLRERISAVKGSIDNYLLELMKKGEEFTWEGLTAFLTVKEEKKKTFIEFAEERIANRTEISDGTRRTQKQLISTLKRYGKIKHFSDLTKTNIVLFAEWLHGQGLKTSTISTRIKHLKAYVREAMKMEIIKSDPFVGLKFSRGESRSDRYLTMNEFRAIRDCKLSSKSLDRVRDMFVVQCLTGMRVSDLMSADFRKAEKKGKRYVYSSNAKKTGEAFYIVLLPDVVRILKKYNWTLPTITTEQYNMRLKVVADAAEVEKPISSHWARHTCGMILLNNGFTIEQVAKVLGHSSIQTTQAVYAKILNSSLDKAFKKIEKKI